MPINKISGAFSIPYPDPANNLSTALQKLWQKVSRAVSRFFSFFNCFNRFKNVFSKREITLLRDERRIHIPEIPKPPVLSDKKIVPLSPLPAVVDIHEHAAMPPYVTFDPELEDLRTFLRDFSSLSADELYKTKIAKQVESLQSVAPSLPPLIKSVAKLLVEMGDKAAKPLFQKFAQQKAQTIDPALQKIFKTLIKPDPLALREGLSVHLHLQLLAKPLPAGINTDDYIKPILHSFTMHEGHRKPIKDMYAHLPNADLALAESLIEAAKKFIEEHQRIERNALCSSIDRQMTEEFKDVKPPSRQSIQRDYIHPILNWLLLSDHMVPLAELFGPGDRSKEDLIDKVVERAIAILVERKIDQYARLLEKTMQGRLGEIAQHMLRVNSSRLADFFSERLSDLISSSPFTETFDALLRDVVSKHINGVIESEKYKTENEKLIEKARHTAQIDPSKPEEEETKKRAQKHLDSVAAHGGQEAFLQHMLLEKYSQHPVCSPDVKQIIDQEILLAKQGNDPSPARKANEKAIFDGIAENLLDLITPVKKKAGSNGEVEEVDAFRELWDRLYFPEEFYDLIEHVEELSKEFVTPETTALFSSIKSPSLEIVKSIFKSSAKELLRKHLVQIVQTAFKKVIDPKSLNEINAMTTLPAINAQLIRVFMRQEMGDKLDDFAPLFHKLVTNNPDLHEANVADIHAVLVKLVKEKFHHFDPKSFFTSETHDEKMGRQNYSELVSEDWVRITKPIIVAFEKEILQAKINGIPFDPQRATTREISDIIKKCYQESSKDNNPLFGEAVMDLLFRVGDLPYETLISFFIKETISTTITGTTKEMRKSHHYLVDTLAESLKETWLNPKRIEDLYSDKPTPEPAFTQQKLAHQIGVTSALVHDLLKRQADRSGMVTRYAIQKVITDKPDEINRQISTIYRKVLGNQIMNENLVVRICDQLFHSLSFAAEKIRLRDNMRIHKI